MPRLLYIVLIAQLDGVFAGRLIPLVHGPEMDFDPETIPEANIEKAEAILAEWEPSAGRSAVFEFEKGGSGS